MTGEIARDLVHLDVAVPNRIECVLAAWEILVDTADLHRNQLLNDVVLTERLVEQ